MYPLVPERGPYIIWNPFSSLLVGKDVIFSCPIEYLLILSVLFYHYFAVCHVSTSHTPSLWRRGSPTAPPGEVLRLLFGSHGALHHVAQGSHLPDKYQETFGQGEAHQGAGGGQPSLGQCPDAERHPQASLSAHTVRGCPLLMRYYGGMDR